MRTAIGSWLRRRLGVAELVAEAQRHAGQLYEASANHEQRLRRLEAFTAAAAWIEHAELDAAPLISVVTPTRDRAPLLRRAIRSVCAQSYPEWELLVADDGSVDETPAVVADAGEGRIRYLRLEGSGPAAARNRALDEARGELVAYLDDDNAMHPGWLKAVAWGFEQRPDADVLYGGWVIDDPLRLDGGPGGGLPELWFTPWDPDLQRGQALADMSAIAHRAGLAEARFDEGLGGFHDWELLARLTRDREPLVLPVIACLYSTGNADRLSSREEHEATREQARRKVGDLYVPRRQATERGKDE